MTLLPPGCNCFFEKAGFCDFGHATPGLSLVGRPLRCLRCPTQRDVGAPPHRREYRTKNSADHSKSKQDPAVSEALFFSSAAKCRMRMLEASSALSIAIRAPY
jgi:hypothetical protein